GDAPGAARRRRLRQGREGSVGTGNDLPHHASVSPPPREAEKRGRADRVHWEVPQRGRWLRRLAGAEVVSEWVLLRRQHPALAGREVAFPQSPWIGSRRFAEASRQQPFCKASRIDQPSACVRAARAAMNDRTHRTTNNTHSAVICEASTTADSEKLNFREMTGTQPPRAPISATAAAACMACLRAQGRRATIRPHTTSAAPTPAGISAVGEAAAGLPSLPVPNVSGVR